MAAIGGTIAYFSDKEVSTGNVMVAGTVDLSVDHKYQTYNGVDCHTCGVTLYSDDTDKVVEYNGVAVDPATNAVVVDSQYIHSEWDAGDDVPSPSQWIWRTDMAHEDTVNNIEAKFVKTFDWQGGATGATLNLVTAADNGVKAELNDCVLFDRLDVERNFDDDQAGVPVVVNVPTTCLHDGVNTIKFTVKNFAQAGGTPFSNPAALKYHFVINGNCDSRLQLGGNCRLWGSKHLTEGDKFWSFNDIKPGDWGTNVISLHPTTNDAKVCSYVFDVAHTGEANLADGINVFVWKDTNGDGVFNDGTSTQIYKGTVSGFNGVQYAGTIAGNSTTYMGVAWCAGSADGAEAVAKDNTNAAGICSPVTMDNTYQGANFTANFGFYAVQARHNDSFQCDSQWPAEQPTAPQTE